jgi:hypothetical protein
MGKKSVWLSIVVLGLVILLPAVISYPCGNGYCESADESIYSCDLDCYCGNGLCDSGEDYYSCSNDCQSSLEYCNDISKGVYCDVQGICVMSRTDASYMPDCTVTSTQTIDFATSSTATRTYYFNTFTLSGTLNFKNSGAPSNPQNGFGIGHAGGNGLATQPSDDDGGQAGNGGDVLSRGLPGTRVNMGTCKSPNCFGGARHNSTAGSAGASVFFVANSFINNGVISVDGGGGGPGQTGEGNCIYIITTYGGGGIGGAGGGGAGKIGVRAISLSGTGRFSAKGGNGGTGGGAGTRDCDSSYDYNCARTNEHGGPGGAGGGGSGGDITIEAGNFATTLPSYLAQNTSSAYNALGGISPSGYNGMCTSWIPSIYTFTQFRGTDGKNGRVTVSGININERYDVNGNLIANACNNNIDDEGDGLIDMMDSDCFNDGTVCPANNGPNRLTGYALNGADGCCGDDIIGGNIFSFGNDYGYIDSSNTYLCYDKVEDPGAWEWRNALAFAAFKIINLTNKNKTVDIISNSDEWYYCNANPVFTQGLTGNGVNNGASPSLANGVKEYACADIMNKIFGYTSSNAFVSDANCAGMSGVNCCGYVDEGARSFTISDLGRIYDDCFVVCRADTTPMDVVYTDYTCDPGDPIRQYFCSDIPSPEPEVTGSDVTIISKDKCKLNPDLQTCLGESTVPISGTTCSNLQGSSCNQGDYCIGGVMVSSLDTSNCCYGYGAETQCHAPFNIITESDCTGSNTGSSVYDNSTDICEAQSRPIGSTGLRCCFGDVISRTPVSIEVFFSNAGDPGQFICYKDYSGNYLAQCIFDNDVSSESNIESFIDNKKELDRSNGRILSTGTMLHTILSFDRIDDNGVVVDNVRRLHVTAASGTQPAPSISTRKFNLTTYDYLEFDVLYPTQECMLSMNLTMNDSVTYISRIINVSRYLTAGDKSRRWNHVKIPIADLNLPTTAIYWSIIFKDYASADYNIVIDSVRLTVNAETINTRGRYCVAGFNRWLTDLDPTGDTPDAYEAACQAQASFDWTGNYCCGDDTDSTHKEAYNDTVKGCFNGAAIDNGWSVAYMSGVDESNPRFNTYTYKGVMYYNNSFIGCQLDPNILPYSDLKLSFSGAPGTVNLISKTTPTQCAVVGPYYCANGAWKKNIQISDYTYPTDFGGQALTLMTVPAGAELIRNGFRGIG